MTYKQKVQKEVYNPAIKKALAIGKSADSTVVSPGVEMAGTYTAEEAKEYCPELNKFFNQ